MNREVRFLIARVAVAEIDAGRKRPRERLCLQWTERTRPRSRQNSSPVGRVATQVDYSDYRDVGGIKFPFELNFQWLDGRYTAKINDVKVNVAIDAAKFGKPSAAK